MTKKIKVLNISGYPRSGSTIIGNILGQINGFFDGGELRHIWEMSLLNNRLCGCGSPLTECNLWKKIFKNSFGGFDQINAKEINTLIKTTTRSKDAISTFIPFLQTQHSKITSKYKDKILELFKGIQKVTNCNIIVDSSKAALYGHVISQIPEIDFYTLHIIRDARAISYSSQKKKIQPDKERTIYMGRVNSLRSSLSWDIRNMLTEFYFSNSPKYLKIKYEDFVKEPKKIIIKITKFLGFENERLPFIDENTVQMGINHSVWGNPGRFANGEVKIKSDNEWEKKLSKKDKLITTFISFPLLYKYGYRIILLLLTGLEFEAMRLIDPLLEILSDYLIIDTLVETV